MKIIYGEKIEHFIHTMLRYYKNNKLSMNLKKTQIMILSKNKDIISKEIEIKNTKIKNKK